MHWTNPLCLEARSFTSVIFCCSFKSWGNSRPPLCPGLGWEGCRPLLLLAPSSQKPTMDSKDEVSDTDSGIILQSGEWFRPPSPQVPEPSTPPSPESMSPGLWALRVAGQTLGGLEGFPCWGSGRERGSCLGKYLQRSPLAPPSLRSWKILSGWGEGLRLWSVQAGRPSGDWFGQRTREKRCGWCVCVRVRERGEEAEKAVSGRGWRVGWEGVNPDHRCPHKAGRAARPPSGPGPSGGGRQAGLQL